MYLSLKDESKEIDLDSNIIKCLLFAHGAAESAEKLKAIVEAAPSGMPVTAEGFEVVGCPVGLDTFVETNSKALVDRYPNFYPRLSNVNLQHALLLLRFCGGMPMVTWACRTTPPRLFKSAAVSFDAKVSDLLAKLLNKPRVAESKGRAIPFRQGGLALRFCEEVSPLAYFASLINSMPVLSLMEASLFGMITLFEGVKSDFKHSLLLNENISC